jgi:hypothetical protein
MVTRITTCQRTSIVVCTPRYLDVGAIIWCVNMSDGYEMRNFSTTHQSLKMIHFVTHTLQGQVDQLLEQVYDLEMRTISLLLRDGF